MAGDDRLELLRSAARLINSTLDLPQVLERLIDTVVEATGAERGFVMLSDAEGGEPQFRAARNLERATLESPSFQVSRNVAAGVYRTGQPVLIADAINDPRYQSFESVRRLGLRSVICAPLLERDRAFGVVYLDNHLRHGLFGQDDLELLTSIADLAAVAIQNARLYGDLAGQMREIHALKTYQDNVFRSVSSAIIAMDRQGRLTALNLSAEKLLGVEGPKAKGTAYTTVLGETLSGHILGLVARAMGMQPQAPREINCLLAGKGQASLRVAASPLLDEGGSVAGCVLVLDDLTELKQLDEARRREQAEKQRVRDIFDRFVPKKVVDQLVRDPAALELGGKLQEITVLFADIRGYTALSERMEPAEIVAALNKYLAISTKSILERDGTLDKYMGDAIVAFFNAPLPLEHHALAAILAALDMQIAVHRSDGDAVRVRYGVGINTGQAVVGNIGTPNLMNYTAIGDAVNVAQRLQSLAQPGEILLSRATYELVAGWIEAIQLDPVTVKGRHAPVECYRLTGTRTRMEAPPGLDMTRHLPLETRH